MAFILINPVFLLFLQIYTHFKDMFSAAQTTASMLSSSGVLSYSDAPSRQGGSLAPGAPIGVPPGQTDTSQGGAGSQQQAALPSGGSGLPA